MRKKKLMYGIHFTVLLCALFFAGYSGAENIQKRKKQYANLNGALNELIQVRRRDPAGAVTMAQARKMLASSNAVKVLLYPKTGKSRDIDLSVLDTHGIPYRASESLIAAEIPLRLLETVASEIGDAGYLTLPGRIEKSVFTTQGKNLLSVNEFHSKGFKGSGAKVAVIDVDFTDYLGAINLGELPASLLVKNFTTQNMSVGTDGHGTACAEIIYDLAPEATMHLIKIENEADLENAIQYCITNSITVISMSLGWFSDSFCDGTGVVNHIANRARDKGILFVQAAGNHAQLHWTGMFTDANANNLCEFSTNGTEQLKIKSTGSGNFIDLILTWDAFPRTSDDYDLYLFDGNMAQVAAAQVVQANDTPIETLSYIVPSTGTAFYYVKVGKYVGSSNLSIRLFIDTYSSFSSTGDVVSSMSILSPADSTGTVAVGAINYINYAAGPIEKFSSIGPTKDGRIKPDLCAPDAVDTYTYGASASNGTSFAAPHVAGAACVLFSADPTMTAAELESTLYTDCLDLGITGKDNVYGYGKLKLAPPSPNDFSGTALSTSSLQWSWSTGTYTGTTVTGYKIYNDETDLLATLTVNTSFWTENALAANTRYTRQIKSYTSTSESIATTASKYTLASAPYALTVTTYTQHTARIAWNGNGATRYRVDRSTNSRTWLTLADFSHELSTAAYNDSGLELSKRYYYAVFGYNGDGVVTKSSITASITTHGLPETFSLLFSTSTTDNVQANSDSLFGSVTVTFPPGALTQNGYLIIHARAYADPQTVSKADQDIAISKLSLHKHTLFTDSVVDMHLYDVVGGTITSNLAKNATLTLAYPDTNNDGLLDNAVYPNDVALLKVLSYTPGTKTWDVVAGNQTVDTAAKTVSAALSHFSMYALAIYLVPENTLSGVRIYPNPYKPGDSRGYGNSTFGEGIVFDRLTANAHIKIFNIAGELVKEAKDDEIDSSGVYVWDTKNNDGQKVASGVYVYVIVNPQDTAMKAAQGKLSILK